MGDRRSCKGSPLDNLTLVDRRAQVAERRVPAMRIIPTLDELEDSELRLRMRTKGVAVDQLTFQGCEEAFAHRIVEPIADRAHRWANASLFTAHAERDQGVLRALMH